MANKFDEKAKHYDSPEQLALAEHFTKVIRSLLDGYQIDTIVDYGGGTGNLALGLADLAEKIILTDISQAMLDQAKQKIEAAGHTHITTQLVDETNKSIKDAYDLLLISLVLHHVPDYKDLLEELFVTLNDNGQFIMIDFYQDLEANYSGFDLDLLAKELESLGLKTVTKELIIEGDALFMRPQGKAFILQAIKTTQL
ncbi:class I SAM-dependent methyltransferase [Streptococcus pacificus]|uniref:Methyltransferase domain-containing protein n=1 Tax=Streptococcus pacificus TaxID=2740577 RepID=A0ABS0ZIL1_9STRE|nr:methyltransferase [Streptococcus pacificus]MBJ8325841.1 methyltransferase domain-containing protein [Streptococcus pacificus]